MWKMCVCCLSQITQKHDVSDYADSNTALSVKKRLQTKTLWSLSDEEVCMFMMNNYVCKCDSVCVCLSSRIPPKLPL